MTESAGATKTATGRVVPFVVGTDAETLRIGFALTAAGAAGTSVDVQWKA